MVQSERRPKRRLRLGRTPARTPRETTRVVVPGGSGGETDGAGKVGMISKQSPKRKSIIS